MPVVTLQPGMRVQLSVTCPIIAEQNQLPTVLQLMVYDELTGWSEPRAICLLLRIIAHGSSDLTRMAKADRAPSGI